MLDVATHLTEYLGTSLLGGGDHQTDWFEFLAKGFEFTHFSYIGQECMYCSTVCHRLVMYS
jgi:hypothetical protein